MHSVWPCLESHAAVSVGRPSDVPLAGSLSGFGHVYETFHMPTLTSKRTICIQWLDEGRWRRDGGCGTMPHGKTSTLNSVSRARVVAMHARQKSNTIKRSGAVSYTHLTLPTNREV